MTEHDRDRSPDHDPAALEEELQNLRRLFTEDLVNIRSRLASLEQRMEELWTTHGPSEAEVRRAEKAKGDKATRAEVKERFAATDDVPPAKDKAKRERREQKRPRPKKERRAR